MNGTKEQSNPNQGSIEKLPLTVRHLIGDRRQGANAKNTEETSTNNGKEEGALTNSVELGAVGLGVNKELAIVSRAKQEKAHEDMDEQKPERQETNVFPHTKKGSHPSRLGSKAVPVNGVGHAGKQTREHSNGESIKGCPANGLVGYLQRKVIPIVTFKDIVAARRQFGGEKLQYK
jgi:hypothetical protein